MRVYLCVLDVVGRVETYIVEDIELGFGTKVAGIGDAASSQVRLCLTCDVSWIAAIGLFASKRARVSDMAPPMEWPQTAGLTKPVSAMKS
jgi:hypothetical protein